MQSAKTSPLKSTPVRQPARSTLKEPLQMRIPVVVKRRFKSHAALKGIDPNELFVEVWEFYEMNNKLTTNEGS
jgi:hypothetical protein